MNEVRLPALSGTSPLGVLAAFGVLRLLDEFSPCRAQLRWDPDGLVAVLCGEWASVDDVVADLTAIVEEVPEGGVLPGVAPGFPPSAAPGLRPAPADLGSHSEAWCAAGDPAFAQETALWVSSVVTDLCAVGGKAAASQFTATSGRQTLTTMLTTPFVEVRKNPEHLRQALVGWRRVEGQTGEYLDHRALVLGADGRGSDKVEMRGVPGATWLALMSFPLFRTTVSLRGRAHTSGWHQVTHNRRVSTELRLPLSARPLTPAAVTALVEHPAFATWPVPAHQRDALGVIGVCRARRYKWPGCNSDGVLTTLT